VAASFVSVSFTPQPRSGSWCLLLLEHLDEFAKLAWYLVSDGKLVEGIRSGNRILSQER
jgi:hypothetical protein